MARPGKKVVRSRLTKEDVEDFKAKKITMMALMIKHNVSEFIMRSWLRRRGIKPKKRQKRPKPVGPPAMADRDMIVIAQWRAYRRIQMGGRWNMFDPAACRASGLHPSSYACIQDNYGFLYDKFEGPQEYSI